MNYRKAVAMTLEGKSFSRDLHAPYLTPNDALEAGIKENRNIFDMAIVETDFDSDGEFVVSYRAVEITIAPPVLAQ